MQEGVPSVQVGVGVFQPMEPAPTDSRDGVPWSAAPPAAPPPPAAGAEEDNRESLLRSALEEKNAIVVFLMNSSAVTVPVRAVVLDRLVQPVPRPRLLRQRRRRHHVGLRRVGHGGGGGLPTAGLVGRGLVLLPEGRKLGA